MPAQSYAHYLHLIWATWDRQPLLVPAIENRLHLCIRQEVEALGCSLLAVGGMPDHLHLLVALTSTITVAQFAQHVKGASAHLVNHQMPLAVEFRWQGGYGVCSISPWDLDRIAAYIRRQREHHTSGTARPEFEAI